jgi:hypothetical protein
MSSKPQNARAKHDETYQKVKRLVAEDNYEGFWEAIHEYENERLKDVGKVAVAAVLFGLIIYGCYHLLFE